jgi:adenine-specific DNA-methyltransferase
MMYPRLKVARNLLREDGVLFVSIDDNEEPRLRLICDEVFGPENYLTTIFVQVRYEGKTLVEDSDFQKLIEQVLVYRKSQLGKLNKSKEEYTLEKFEWEIVESGIPRTVTLGKKEVKIFSPGSFQINRVAPSQGGLKEIWASGKVLDGNSSGRFFRDFIEGRVTEDGLGVLYKVEGIGDDGHGHRYFTGPLRAGATKGKYYQGVPKARLAADAGTKESPIACFFNFADAFGNCRHEGSVDFRSGKKPLAFLHELLKLGTSGLESELILDFFAGSGTTAHAVFELNQQDGGNRRFLLVQLPEATGQSQFRTIADITKERLRNAAKKLREEIPEIAGDLGFRVFKLASSNIRAWEPDRDKLAETLEASIEHLKSNRTEQDILFELLLKLGLDLCVPIETKKVIGSANENHVIYAIGSGALLVCLSNVVSRGDAEPLALGLVEWHQTLKPAGETTVVFRDSAFADDVAKTNLTAILQQHGLETVRSL